MFPVNGIKLHIMATWYVIQADGRTQNKKQALDEEVNSHDHRMFRKVGVERMAINDTSRREDRMKHFLLSRYRTDINRRKYTRITPFSLYLAHTRPISSVS